VGFGTGFHGNPVWQGVGLVCPERLGTEQVTQRSSSSDICQFNEFIVFILTNAILASNLRKIHFIVKFMVYLTYFTIGACSAVAKQQQNLVGAQELACAADVQIKLHLSGMPMGLVLVCAHGEAQ
jgi:hypothetical protein